VLTHPEHIRDVLVTHQKQFRRGRGLERTTILLGQGLLTSEGDFHLRQRRMMQPAFHRQRIAGHAQTMADYADRHIADWQDDSVRDVWRDFNALTLAIAGKTLFDSDVEGDTGAISAALNASLDAFRLAVLPGGQFLTHLPIPAARRFKAARAKLDAIIYRIIAEHRASPVERSDLMAMLLAATDDEGDGGGMTDAQVRDEAVTILLAGHETTATALTWTSWLLASNPDVAARLEAEVDAALGGRLPTMDDLPRLGYARQVFAEAMRLYPPAYTLGHRAVGEYDVGGYRFPKRTVFLLPQYVVHRDPRWWPDPERFDPDRFAPGADASRPKFAYFPFSAGPRQCIGEPFAWMEGVMVLATLVRRWRFRRDATTRVGVLPIITLRPRYGMSLRLERRA
jgi:cytochrome P450